MPKRVAETTVEDTAREERRRKRKREGEYQEYNKVLIRLDDEQERDLAAHLHLASEYRKAHPITRRPGPRKQGVNPPPNSKEFSMRESWTAWPLPAKVVPRPEPIANTFTNVDHALSRAIQSEIDSCLLRIAREGIKAGGHGVMSADEGAPYHITQEVTRTVMTKLDRLLHALGRMKFQHLGSERMMKRAAPSKWDEVVGIAGISECIDSEETMKRVVERCNKLFKEDIHWEKE